MARLASALSSAALERSRVAVAVSSDWSVAMPRLESSAARTSVFSFSSRVTLASSTLAAAAFAEASARSIWTSNLRRVERGQHVAFLHLLVLVDRDRTDDAGQFAGNVDLGKRLQRAGSRHRDGEVGDSGRHRGVVDLGRRSDIPLIAGEARDDDDQRKQAIDPAATALVLQPRVVKPERRLDAGIRFRLWRIDNLVQAGPL